MCSIVFPANWERNEERGERSLYVLPLVCPALNLWVEQCCRFGILGSGSKQRQLLSGSEGEQGKLRWADVMNNVDRCFLHVIIIPWKQLWFESLSSKSPLWVMERLPRIGASQDDAAQSDVAQKAPPRRKRDVGLIRCCSLSKKIQRPTFLSGCDPIGIQWILTITSVKPRFQQHCDPNFLTVPSLLQSQFICELCSWRGGLH